MDERWERLRRGWRTMAPIEMFFTALGYITYAIAAFSLFAVLFLVVNFNDVEKGFPAGEGFLKTIKGYGIGLFTVAAVVFYYLARWIMDSRVPDARRSASARYDASRIATELTADPDFQQAGSWEWRERVAYDVVPELREYAESDDWNDRRFARQTVKEGWELYLKSRDSL